MCTVSDFKASNTAYLIYCAKRSISQMAFSYLREVSIVKVGKRFVDIDGEKYTDRFALHHDSDGYLSCFYDNRYDDNFVLFPTKQQADSYFEHMQLRLWFMLNANWSYAGPYGIDSLSFGQLKEIRKIIEVGASDFWVPVSDKLPKVNDEYCVTMVFNGEPIVTECSFINGLWRQDGNIVDQNVVAWRDVIKPYTENK